MTRIYVLHENDEWTVRLTQELEALELPYEVWHLAAGSMSLDANPPEGVFFSRMSASAHTRGHRYSPEFTMGLLSWLEAHGRVVVNGTRALQLEISKVQQYLALQRAGIRTPRTVAVLGRDALLAAAASFAPAPFITKHNRAGKGLGVQLFHSLDALREYLYGPLYDPPADGIWLLQEYIRAPEPYIIRCEFVGGRFLYAVRVDTSQGFELCPADACQIGDMFCPVGEDARVRPKFEILDSFDPDVIRSYERFLEANGVRVAGIESIVDERGVRYTYDINTNTNYNSQAEQVAGKNGMRAVALYLGGLLARAYPDAVTSALPTA
ncbi:MAG: alpha-L-glutamate ligase [Thermoflavifilum sp.]|nr:alpha-L-glutamate ligase [Thermoflavifilum sp.]MCL6514825.1 alpha-L-glutamate ligase [Alicyclobacillus sp.]